MPHTRKKKKNINHFTGIKHNDIIIDSPEEASHIFNDYFVNIASNLIEQPDENCTLNIVENNPNSMFISAVTENEILEIINNLKNKTSAGEDNISNFLIKKIKHYIVKPITFIIYQSFLTGCFPNLLKVAIVKPIFKKGDSLLLENFRPISLLSSFSSFSKIFELAMCSV